MPSHRLAPLTNSTFGIVKQEHTFNDSAMALAPSARMPLRERSMLVTVSFSYNTSKHQQTTKHSMPNHRLTCRLTPLTNSTFGILKQEHTFNDSAMALAPLSPILFIERSMFVTVLFSYNTSKHQSTTKHSMPNHRLAPLTNSTFGIMKQQHTFNDSAMALAPSAPMSFTER